MGFNQMTKYLLWLVLLISGPTYAQIIIPIPGPTASFTCQIPGATGVGDLGRCHQAWAQSLAGTPSVTCNTAEFNRRWEVGIQNTWDFKFDWSRSMVDCPTAGSGTVTLGYSGPPLVCPPGSTQDSITNGIPSCSCHKNAGGMFQLWKNSYQDCMRTGSQPYPPMQANH